MPYRLLVLSDTPSGLDPRAWDLLRFIAKNSAWAGVYLLASINPAYPLPWDAKLTEVTGFGADLKFAGGHLVWLDPAFGPLTANPDPLPLAETPNRACSALATALAYVNTHVRCARIAISRAVVARQQRRRNARADRRGQPGRRVRVRPRLGQRARAHRHD